MDVETFGLHATVEEDGGGEDAEPWGSSAMVAQGKPMVHGVEVFRSFSVFGGFQ